MSLKQPLLAVARRVGLLPVLERLRFTVKWLLTHRVNSDFCRENPSFSRPPAWWMHDMYAHVDLGLYVSSGEKHATILQGVMAKHLHEGPLDVADWGCGMARVARHVGQNHRLVGFDINGAAVAWINANLPDLTAHAHGPLPPLPLEDNSLDAIYSISVLTHLPQADAKAWMIEILRILRPGGLFMCTVHGRHQTGSLTAQERAKFEKGEPIYRGNVQRGSRNYATYLPESYLREKLFADFNLLEMGNQEIGQELWVLRKP